MSNNDIIKTQTDDTTPLEYLIAGSVVLLFGLLYWLLNQGGFEVGNTLKPQTTHLVSSSELLPTTAISDLTLEQPSLLSSATGNQTDGNASANLNTDSDDKDSNTANSLLYASTPAANANNPPISADTNKLKAELTAQQTALDKLRAYTLQQQQTQLAQLRTQAATEQQAALDKLRQELTAQQQAEMEKLRQELTPKPTVVETPASTSIQTTNSQPPVANASTQAANTQPPVVDVSKPNQPTEKVSKSTFVQNLANAINSEQRPLSLLFDQVNFAPGSAELDATAKQQIQLLADFMNQYPNKKILIRGHTDNTGEQNINPALSLARSSNMKTMLVDFGVSPKRINVEGLGALYPIASNDTEEGRSKNRRIELVIFE